MIVSFRREPPALSPRAPRAREEAELPRDTVDLSEQESAPPATVPCPLCDGGASCGPCYGSGYLWSGALCPWCGGSKKCHRCGGAGTIPAPSFVIVVIPVVSWQARPATVAPFQPPRREG